MRIRATLSLAILVACTAAPVFAQEGITVTGTASRWVSPDAVEVHFRISADAELAIEVVEEFRQKETQILEAVTRLREGSGEGEDAVPGEADNLVHQLGGVTFAPGAGGGMAAMMVMGGEESSTAAYTIRRDLTLVLNNVDISDLTGTLSRVARVLDSMTEAGAEFAGATENPFMPRMPGQGEAGPVRFVVTNLDQLQREVAREALGNAQQEAQRIAEAVSVRLGGVRAVTEMGSDTGENGGFDSFFSLMLSQAMRESGQDAPESIQVEVTATYSVTYAIQ